MKISNECYQYLSGEKFSSGYYMPLENNPLYSRLETIMMLVKGTSVLHVGCCDHLPLIRQKIEQHTWLHGLLEEECKDVIGIDINREAIDFINKNNLCKNEVYCADITSQDFVEVLPKKEIEVVLLGEIVEHLDNPVCFLQRTRENLQQYGFRGKYVITVPNAYCILRRPYAERGYEGINSDHRYWFTPYTICKILVQAGLYPEELQFVSYGLGGNGANIFTETLFAIMEKARKRPSKYKSFRGDQMIVTASDKHAVE